MATERKHVEVNLKNYEALQELEKGKSAKNVAAKFNVLGGLEDGRRGTFSIA